ncbi:MAG: hypothetical protein ACRC11_11015 [Xenococcaceae cyanobacterium]
MKSENLNLFLNDFAVDANINGILVKVLFDEEYLPLELGAEGRALTATGKTEDLKTIRHGMAISIEGKNYSVVGVHPIMDGKFTELELKESG